MSEIASLEKLYRDWKATKGFESSYSSDFIDYQGLAVGIEEVDINVKAIKQCEEGIRQMKSAI